MLHKLFADTQHVFRIKTQAKVELFRSIWDPRECQVMLRQGLAKLPRLAFKSLCKFRQSLNFQIPCFSLLGNWDYTLATRPSSDGVLSLTGWDILYGMCVLRTNCGSWFSPPCGSWGSNLLQQAWPIPL